MPLALTHAERPGNDWNPNPTFVVMECGAWTMITETADDISAQPLIDFYTPPHAHKATCPECRKKLAERSATSRELERTR